MVICISALPDQTNPKSTTLPSSWQQVHARLLTVVGVHKELETTKQRKKESKSSQRAVEQPEKSEKKECSKEQCEAGSSNMAAAAPCHWAHGSSFPRPDPVPPLRQIKEHFKTEGQQAKERDEKRRN